MKWSTRHAHVSRVQLHRMNNHWDKYHSNWNELEAPLRPVQQTVGIMEREGGTSERDVVLLGVTPELAGLGRTLLAVDASLQMIGALWKGDTPTRRAVVGEWSALPATDHGMDAIVGDGSLNVVDHSDVRQAILRESARVLRPEGRLAVRVFTSPVRREGLSGIKKEVLSGVIENFHAFKWKLAMALAGADPNRSVPVSLIRDAANELFPDRALLARSTGWRHSSINTVDAYAGSQVVYSFPTRAQIVREASIAFKKVRLMRSGVYPLSERCPILVAELAAL